MNTSTNLGRGSAYLRKALILRRAQTERRLAERKALRGGAL